MSSLWLPSATQPRKSHHLSTTLSSCAPRLAIILMSRSAAVRRGRLAPSALDIASSGAMCTSLDANLASPIRTQLACNQGAVSMQSETISSHLGCEFGDPNLEHHVLELRHKRVGLHQARLSLADLFGRLL